MNSKTLLAGAAIAAALFAAGASQAQSYDVTVWNGAPDGVSSTTYAGATRPPARRSRISPISARSTG